MRRAIRATLHNLPAAGAAAALSAHEVGAQVLMVEKRPQPGGNSLVSSASTVYPQTPADAGRFTQYLIEVCEGTTPAEVIETYLRGLLELPAGGQGWYWPAVDSPMPRNSSVPTRPRVLLAALALPAAPVTGYTWPSRPAPHCGTRLIRPAP